MKCRFCENKLQHEIIDLINCPPSNSFLNENQIGEPETYFPLKLYFCERCFLVQVDEYKKFNEIFSASYPYFSSYSSSWLEHCNFSSYSSSWLEHCKKYADMMIKTFGLNRKSKIIEVASNDGYLLQYFKEKGIPVLGIEPTSSTAKVAIEKGIETIQEFFGVKLALELKNKGIQADLLIGNNVLAHVSNINDFVKGLKIALKDTGIITIEFQHLMRLVENNEFDTIYQEHFSYFSLTAVKNIFQAHGLELFNVEEIPTHGGSLRIYARHKGDKLWSINQSVEILIKKEKQKRMDKITYYADFQKKADKIKYDLVSFIIKQKINNKKIIAYGAAAKGNTLLNYCGIKKDLIEYVVDKSPYKQNKFLPGSHIKVVAEENIRVTKPDFILILPWNIKDEIINQLNYVKEWNARFIVPIPTLEVV